MKIFDSRIYHSSMDKGPINDSPVGMGLYLYKQVTFFDVTTSTYFTTSPIRVIRAWKFFVELIKSGCGPTLHVFYGELNLPAILGPNLVDRSFEKEPWLCLYICEDSTHGALIAIDFEMF